MGAYHVRANSAALSHVSAALSHVGDHETGETNPDGLLVRIEHPSPNHRKKRLEPGSTLLSAASEVAAKLGSIQMVFESCRRAKESGHYAPP